MDCVTLGKTGTIVLYEKNRTVMRNGTFCVQMFSAAVRTKLLLVCIDASTYEVLTSEGCRE
jgi:hypothetical protein